MIQVSDLRLLPADGGDSSHSWSGERMLQIFLLSPLNTEYLPLDCEHWLTLYDSVIISHLTTWSDDVVTMTHSSTSTSPALINIKRLDNISSMKKEKTWKASHASCLQSNSISLIMPPIASLSYCFLILVQIFSSSQTVVKQLIL